MKRKQASLAMIACLAASCWGLPASAQSDLLLSVAPGSEAVMPGDVVTVTLEVANLSAAINGLQALMHYDAALLTLDAVVPTDLGLPPPAQGWEVVTVDDAGGDLTYAAVVFGDSHAADGAVATLYFTAIEEGTTSITFLPDSNPYYTKLTVAADNSTIFPTKADSGSIVIDCDDGLFCNGEENVVGGTCVSTGDPCAPLVCDEANDICFSPIHVGALEVFYSGRFLDAPDPSHDFLAGGSSADLANITNYMRGITGLRVFFNDVVDFATVPQDAFAFEWTTGTGTLFSPVTDPGNFTVTADDASGATIVTITVADDYVRRRWLKVTIDSTQVTNMGVELDGEMFGNPVTLPSGDGGPGGDSVFYLGNLTGDVNGDRKTTLTDIGLIRAVLNPFLNVPITDVFDVDKDGKVLLADVGDARGEVNPFFMLPLISP